MALSIGLSGLSGSLGVPGQANHPTVQAAVDTLMAMAARKGIPVSYRCEGLRRSGMPSRRALAWLAWELWKRCCIQP